MSARLAPRELILASGGRFDVGQFSHWLNGDYTATADSAIVVAQVLHADPVEVLRAAAHDLLADAIAGLISEAARLAAVEEPVGVEPNPADLFGRLHARLHDAQARVGQNEADIESAAGMLYDHHQALGDARARFDRLEAEVAALRETGWTTDRAPRGHIDDPGVHEHPDSDY